MRLLRNRWFLLLLVLLGLAGAAVFPFLWRDWVEARAQDEIYTVESVAPQRVAIVFGARVYRSGRLSAMLRDRVETAVRLYEAGKVDRILFSGDNSSPDYNEPDAMIAYARRGVPDAAMQPDYAGLRTYDTCYRARAVFHVRSAILVTQDFHLPRAIFTCGRLGVASVGVAADLRTYHPRSIAWSETREIPATLVALFDVIRRRPPTFLGEPIPIAAVP